VPVASFHGKEKEMADRLTRDQRSALMANIRTKHTTPELKVRSVAHRLGFRFRLHRKDLPGSPDVVFPRLRAALFIHGCFWHRHRACGKASIPATRPEFWAEKFGRNVARDAIAKRKLRRAGWRVLVIWECEIKDELKIANRLALFLGARSLTARSSPRALRRTS
jgi:DNA mismatch endonuclease (patch repair protein)